MYLLKSITKVRKTPYLKKYNKSKEAVLWQPLSIGAGGGFRCKERVIFEIADFHVHLNMAGNYF